MSTRTKQISDMSLPELRRAIARFDRLGYVPANEAGRYDTIVRRIAILEAQR